MAKSANLNGVQVRSSPFLQNRLIELASRFLFVTFAVGHWRGSLHGKLCEIVNSMKVTSCSFTRRYSVSARAEINY